jgi:protein tyrosine phosphatase (PTP) superfamily phosphohydrolase (DUF442 family)
MVTVPVARTLTGSAFAAGAALVLLLLLGACGTDDAAQQPPTPAGPPVAATAAAATPVLGAQGEPLGLEHYRRLSERIGQGGQPVGETAFRNLTALGYDTIVSVDGARPDTESARRWGLRYVHVPVEYSGITREQSLRLVQAVRTARGPVYFHCHHGLHRGPAAAAIARQAVDGVSAAQADADLRSSGCSAHYEGLYRDVTAFVVPTEAEMAAVPTDLPEIAPVGGMVDHMAAASRCFERLQACQKSSWGSPEGQPDVSPPHEATILMEHFREMQRLDEARSRGERFVRGLLESETASDRVAASLRSGRKDEASAALAAVKKTCDTCHDAHRDR